MEFAGGGTNLWVMDSDRMSSGIINADTGQIVAYRPAKYDPSNIHYEIPIVSANGEYSAGIDADGRSVLWANSDGRVIFVAPDDWYLRGVSDDGTLAIIVGPSTQLVRTTDGSMVVELDSGLPMSNAVFSPDGRYVVTNNHGLVFPSFPSIRIWDVSNGAMLGSIGSDPLSGWSSDFTPDGSRLVVGGYAGQIIIFDFNKLIAGIGGEEAVVRSIPAHDAFITEVNVSPDGSMAFSQAWDEPVKLWNLETGENLGEFGTIDPESADPPAAAFHPTEPWLYATRSRDEIAIYTLDIDQLMQIARTRLTRDFSEEECQLYLRRTCNEDA
jgi:WD40 repeat protein